MIYNKGTVSFDQWLEKLTEAINPNNTENTHSTIRSSNTYITDDVDDPNTKENEVPKFDLSRLQQIYWSGADIDEAIIELKNELA